MNLEDTIFILNVRIRMIKDTLRLNPPPELFLERSMDDLVFIDTVLAQLTGTLSENGSRYLDYVSDTEWQFNQLLTEFTLDSSPFSVTVFPDTRNKITALHDNSDTRRKAHDAFSLPAEIARAEPVVSSAELSGLLGGI